MKDTVGIAVVGGGITGAFTAYFLARLGFATTLIERDGIGSHASGNNPGGLNPLHGPGIPGPMQELALESFRLHLENWDSIDHLSDTEFRPRMSPRLHLAMDEGDLAQLERAKAPYESTPGFSAAWVDGDELRAAEPRLNPAVLRGLRTVGNAKVDAGSYTRAVADAASRLGAKKIEGKVTDLRRRGDRITGVLVDSVTLTCDGVVIASGPWSGEAERWLDTDIPVEPVKGEMLLVQGSGGGVETDLAWRDVAVYGTGGKEVWLGGTEDRVGFDSTPQHAARVSILDRVNLLLPGMGPARVLRQRAALRPATPDGFPIVGMVSGCQNACLALGGGRKGVLFSTGMGLAAAELLTSGATDVPVAPCSPSRSTLDPAEVGR